jgi:hypothetical protein
VGSYAGLLDRWHLQESKIEHTGLLLAKPMQHAFLQKSPNTSFSALCLPPTHQAVSTQAQGPSRKPERNANFWRPWPGEVAFCFMQFWLSKAREALLGIFLSRLAVTRWPCCQYIKLDNAALLLRKLHFDYVDYENA